MSLINPRVAELLAFRRGLLWSQGADVKQMMYLAPAHVIKITACGEN